MTNPGLSARALKTPPSPIRKLTPLAHRAKEAGRKIYHLNIGQPDIKSPKEYFDGIKMYHQDVLAYEDSQGNQALCRAWSNSINRTLSVDTKPENFLITSGASEALIFVFMVCCDPGDEVIIFDPTYANYLGFASITGVKLVPVPCEIENNFDLPPRHLIEQRITEKTKAILLCNPNNPTGTVYSRQQLEILLEICHEKNLFLVVDETYREFVYDGLEPVSVLNVAPKSRHVVVVDSLSKRFSLCGARIGCLITNDEQVRATTLNLAQARLCAPTIEQFAAAHLLETISDEFMMDVKNEYQRRRDVLFDAISSISGVYAQKPKGAFYFIARLPVGNAEHFASFMLKDFSYQDTTTFVAPAAGFYMQEGQGLNKIRIAYVLNEEDLVKAVEVLKLGLEKYCEG